VKRPAVAAILLIIAARILIVGAALVVAAFMIRLLGLRLEEKSVASILVWIAYLGLWILLARLLLKPFDAAIGRMLSKDR
jgi:hypothetical protein